MSEPLEYSLSRLELWLLLSKFGPAIVFGLEDPTRGLSPNALAEANATVLKGLLTRGIVANTSPDGNFDIKDNGLLAVLETIAHPQHSVLIGLRSEEGKKMSTFHYGDQNQVILIEALTEDQILLSPCQKQQVSAWVMTPFEKKVFMQSGDAQPIELDESTIQAIVAMMQKKEEKEALSYLEHRGVPVGLANDMMLALYKPEISLVLAVFANRDDGVQPANPLSVAACGKYLWLMEPANRKEDTVILRQISKERLFERFSYLLPS